MSASTSKSKETAAARKLRLAQELVKKAKEAEQAAWQTKWQEKVKDPVYQAEQALRREQSDIRERVRLINKENKALAKIPAPPSNMDINFTAYHEAGHAVIAEVLSGGVSLATIVPKMIAEPGSTNSSALTFSSAGHVQYNGALPLPARQRVLVTVACALAGGFTADKAGDEYADEGMGGDNRQICEAIKSLGYREESDEFYELHREAVALCVSLLGRPEVWQAVEDVKELLLSEKTISGRDVRAIVKMQQFPELIKIDITKQLCFHYRKNRPEGGASFQLGIGVTTGTSGYWYRGYELSRPDYIEKVTTENAQPQLRRVKRAVQQNLFGGAA